jgi:hypothetical protein
MLELILFFEDNQRANNMTTRRLTTVVATTLLSLGLAIGGSVSLANEEKGNAAEHKFELARQYYGQCAATDSSEFDAIKPQLRAFTDMEVMAETMADPAKFMQLMAVVNDPRSIHVMTKCATEPVMWDTWMSGMTDFNKMSRAMSHFMNPAMYQPMMQMADPAYYTRWMNAMANPAFYQPVTSLADPNWYTPRINWMTNPQSMQPMFNMMNMGNYFAPISTAGNSTPESAN